MAAPADTWSPASWRGFPAQQQPDWPDEASLAAATERLNQYPPLVFAGEARDLTRALATVAEGRRSRSARSSRSSSRWRPS